MRKETFSEEQIALALREVVTIPFTEQMISGQALFEENTNAEGYYVSALNVIRYI